jgi:hypothetical protein
MPAGKQSKSIAPHRDEPAARSAVRAASILRKTVISLFCLWQICAVAVWLLPGGSRPKEHLERYFRDYIYLTGCWQNWELFSPNPSDLNLYLEAEITRGDGTQSISSFHRPSQDGLVRRYQDERFRKMVYNIDWRSDKRLLPALARWAAIDAERNSQRDFPMSVVLTEHYARIGPPPFHSQPYQSDTVYSQTFVTPPDGRGAGAR